MRIAFLCKRRYMSKDVILDRYARLYEIPRQLALLGHEVLGLCMSYQNVPPGQWTHDATPGTLQWESYAAGHVIVPALAAYPARMLKRLRAFKPDVLVGASDIPHVVLTAWLARRLGVPYAIDLYDNFEGFGQARIPGFVPALQRAVREAGLVTATSTLLQAMVQQDYQAQGKVLAMPSTIDQTVFRSFDQQQCRQALGLPLDTVHVGVDVRFDHPDAFNAAYGVTARGVSLVRPDGVVAWRRPDDAPERNACAFMSVGQKGTSEPV